jgi:hypothetical protein
VNRKYGPEHIEWLQENIAGCHFKDLTEKFNRQFGMTLKISTMVSLTDRHGLHNGIDRRLNTAMVEAGKAHRFKKGSSPWNKGTKGVTTGFKRGQMPHNYKPIGSERVNADGYVDIKVADGQKQHNWLGKHIFIWEEHNGPVPKGHAVIFGDGDQRNFDINNLILVSRKQLVTLNHKGLIQKDADLTKSAIAVVDILHKISKRSKSTKVRRGHKPAAENPH